MVQAWLHVVVLSIRSSSVAWRSFVAQDMETRRDISERLLGLKALNMQLELLKIGNEMAKDTLTRAINRVMA